MDTHAGNALLRKQHSCICTGSASGYRKAWGRLLLWKQKTLVKQNLYLTQGKDENENRISGTGESAIKLGGKRSARQELQYHREHNVRVKIVDIPTTTIDFLGISEISTMILGYRNKYLGLHD